MHYVFLSTHTTVGLLHKSGRNLNTIAILSPTVYDRYSPKTKLKFMGAAVLEILDIAVRKNNHSDLLCKLTCISSFSLSSFICFSFHIFSASGI